MPSSAVSSRPRIADSAHDNVAAERPSDVPISQASRSDEPRRFWLEAFRDVCAETDRRAALLSPKEQVIKSMPSPSPAKRHRAHVTWFFEQFLLRQFAPDYKP